MEDRKIEIDRVSSLKVGDKFMYAGIWRTVVKSKRGDAIRFKSQIFLNNYSSLPSNSNQYVEIERKIV